MALVVKDRVKETTTTTGTGTITLAGAVDGFQSFSAALADGDTTYYAISETSTGEWEVGLGTFTATGTTLARTTVLASSNAGSAVSLTAEADVFITQPASKSVFFDGSGDLTLNQDPTSALHAATKEYVDTIAAAGLHYHDPVRVEQEGNLSATYDNGTAGVGATLTNNSTQAALSIDGVTLSLNDRVLIYEQTNAYENGVYTVTDTGSASTNWVLTRSTDTDSYAPSDPDSLGQGDAFFVLEGAAGAGELYVMNTEGTITFGTTGITFTQVASTAVFTAGDGLTLTGTTFAVGAGTGVTVNANDIAIGQAVGTSDSPTFAGMTTTADITFGSNDKASFGTTLDIYSDGTDSYVVEGGTGNLYIDSADLSIRNAAGTATMASFDDTGSVTLNHNNSTKLTTQSYGIDVTGNVQSDGLVLAGDATFGDNDKAIFGAGSDLQIYHDGAASYIHDVGTGNLFVRGNNLALKNADGSKSYFFGTNGGAANVYYDGSSRLATTSTGVDVTGTVTADGLTVDGDVFFDGNTNGDYSLVLGNNEGASGSVRGITRLGMQGQGASFATYKGAEIRAEELQLGDYRTELFFATRSNTSDVAPKDRIKISNNGDISFYEDTGTTAKFFWDASAELLKIGGIETIGTFPLMVKSNASHHGIHIEEASGNEGYTLGVDADGDLGFYNSGSTTASVTFDDSGNVGIGTSSPSRLLDVSGVQGWESSGTEVAYLNPTATGTDFGLKNSSGTLVVRFDGRPSGDVYFNTGGNVGIGTASPDSELHVKNGNASVADTQLNLEGAVGGYGTGIQFTSQLTGGAVAQMAKIVADGSNSWNTTASTQDARLTFHTTNDGVSVERMRIDSSGNLLVGTTDTDPSNNSSGTGVAVSSDGRIFAGGSAASQFNRIGSDGSVINIRKDGTTVGSIGAAAGDVFIGTGDIGLRFYDGSTSVIPWKASTNAISNGYSDLGHPSYRFKDLYLSGAVNAGSAVIDGHTLQDSTNRSGLLEVSSSLGTWKGFSIASTSTSHWSIMGDQDDFGLYDDVNNEWILKYNENNSTELYYNGGRKLETQSGGVLVTGTCTATSFVGNGSGLTNLPAVDYFETDVEIYSDDLGADIDLKWFTGGSGSYGGGLSFLDSEVEEAYVRYTPQQGTTPRKLESHCDGDLLISTFAANSQLDIQANGSGSDLNLSANDDIIISFGNGSETLTFNAGGGDITSTCEINALFFEATSDINLKENISLLTDPTSKLLEISGYSYNFIDSGKAAYGVIAQEVEKVLPNAVSERAEGTKSVDYNAIVALLVETIKDQEKRIAVLEEKVGV